MSYQETIRASYAHVETEADVPNPGEHSESASVDRERVRSPDPRPRTPDPRPRTPAPTTVPSLQPPVVLAPPGGALVSDVPLYSFQPQHYGTHIPVTPTPRSTNPTAPLRNLFTSRLSSYHESTRHAPTSTVPPSLIADTHPAPRHSPHNPFVAPTTSVLRRETTYPLGSVSTHHPFPSHYASWD